MEVKEEEEYLCTLPDDCISAILSWTTPLDACTSSLVSSSLRSVADSDAVWDKFLPSDYPQIVSASSLTTTPMINFSSKKQLYARLCSPLLLHGGTKSFLLEKESGKKSYILSARELSITWSNEPMYWVWSSTPKSRFSKVAVLRATCWLEIKAKIRSGMLSPNTKYGAYLIMEITERAYGLDSMPCETSVEVVGNHRHHVSATTAYLQCPHSSKQQTERPFYTNHSMRKKMTINNGGDEHRLPCKRKDGWMEIELGEFFSGQTTMDGDDDEAITMSLKEVKGYQLKGGLIIEGIELRPNTKH